MFVVPSFPAAPIWGPENSDAELNGGEMVPYQPQNEAGIFGTCGRTLSSITQNHIMYTYLAQSQYPRGQSHQNPAYWLSLFHPKDHP